MFRTALLRVKRQGSFLFSTFHLVSHTKGIKKSLNVCLSVIFSWKKIRDVCAIRIKDSFCGQDILPMDLTDRSSIASLRNNREDLLFKGFHVLLC
jgi:hypothetical protein